MRLVALRSAGFNHVDLPAAAAWACRCRVPEYSPYAVAEHAVALVLALNRKIHRAYARVREWNFSLDGLVGFDLHGKTVAWSARAASGARGAHLPRLRLPGAGRGPEPVRRGGARSWASSYGARAALARGATSSRCTCRSRPPRSHLIDAKALALMKRGVDARSTPAAARSSTAGR